jgi:hypothetical protein
MLYLIFISIALLMLLMGTQIYGIINNKINDNYDLRSTLAYITTKAHQEDTEYALTTKSDLAFPALVFTDYIDGATYETVIYHYNKAVYEVVIERGTHFEPEEGNIIINNINYFSYSFIDNILIVAVTNTHGQSARTAISIITSQ